MGMQSFVAPLIVLALFHHLSVNAFPNSTNNGKLSPDHFKQGIRFDLFDLSLCQTMYAVSTTQNVAVSPVSVKLVLAMLYEAASGETAAELQRTLYLPTSKYETRRKFGSIYKALTTPSNNTDLRIGSNLFVSPAVGVQKTYYQQLLMKYYSAGITVVDFKKPQEAAKEVNDWVCNATNGKITSMMDPNDPDIPYLTMVISNALYFKGKWEIPFSPNATKKDTFYLKNNQSIEIDMMENNDTYYIAEDLEGNYILLRLPFLDNIYSFYIVLPLERTGLDDVLPQLTPDQIRKNIKDLTKISATLYLPKFSFEYSVDMEPILVKLGIKKIFDPATAEFPFISNHSNIHVSKILHKAGLDINEFGSTVYAATHATMDTRIGLGKAEVRVDHPFMFFIKDDTAETIVFAAKVENPLRIPETKEKNTLRTHETKKVEDPLRTPTTKKVENLLSTPNARSDTRSKPRSRPRV